MNRIAAAVEEARRAIGTYEEVDISDLPDDEETADAVALTAAQPGKG